MPNSLKCQSPHTLLTGTCPDPSLKSLANCDFFRIAGRTPGVPKNMSERNVFQGGYAYRNLNRTNSFVREMITS